MLVDCDTTNGGCNGGMYDAAWKFLQAKGGAMKTSSYAYTSGPTGTVRKFVLDRYYQDGPAQVSIHLLTPNCFRFDRVCRPELLANSTAPPLAPRWLLSAGSRLTPTPPPSWPTCKATDRFQLPWRSSTPSTATRKMKWRPGSHHQHYFDPI